MPKASKAKKLVLVLVTSVLVTDASKEAQVTQIIQEMVLDRVSCIHYLMEFQKDKKANTWALINFGSEINAITPVYAKNLGFQTRKTNAEAQKSNSSLLETYGNGHCRFLGEK